MVGNCGLIYFSNDFNELYSFPIPYPSVLIDLFMVFWAGEMVGIEEEGVSESDGGKSGVQS